MWPSRCDACARAGQLGQYGELEEVTIHHHPRTGRHLGLGRAVFRQVPAAKRCVQELHNKPVMGNLLSVVLDAFGALWEATCVSYLRDG